MLKKIVLIIVTWAIFFVLERLRQKIEKLDKVIGVAGIVAFITTLGVFIPYIYEYLDKTEQQESTTQSPTPTVETITPTLEPASTSTPTPTEEPTLTESPTPEPPTTPIPEKIVPVETHTPNDVSWSVDILTWDAENDFGIDGNKYGGGVKVVISNMFTSMGSGLENDITSRIMLPLNNPSDHRYYGYFVLDQSMFGSASSATIRILSNDTELYSTGEIDGNNTSPFYFDVDFGNADSLIIETVATLRGTSFTYGMVSPKK